MSKVAELADQIVGLTALDLAELSKVIQEKTGVKPAAMAVAAAPAAGGAAVVEEKTDFNVVLTGFGDKKLNVIKVVREVTGLGLKEAKDLVEAVPSVVKEGLPKAEAEAVKAKLVEGGATIELK